MPMSQGVHCLLVDDHALFADALGLLIAHRHPTAQLSTANRLSGALEQLRQAPDIGLVLLDLNLPDSRGLDTLAQLREAAPMARVIVLSADDRAETVMAALDGGASGFIPKSADASALDQALRTVLGGGVHVPPALTRSAESASGSELPPLTARQMDVFRCLVGGLSNKLIARELALSDSTVKTHVQAIFDKLGVTSRAQVVLHAARMGWLP
ncbi:response regulator transcription factor [Ideonella sp. 4Y16]|uniref:Response regulator transcription factor n=1 Tax=Ideonella alba TaxID=2824118 RepID=A0A940YCJ4_9BURK|nr:response regulator transcription factor [Ideonella alba]MBQ0931658.1 response regulator transcription factor [Ideonella alba]MBQ0944092.1 response regulator transcription factor [Ideonella alba]